MRIYLKELKSMQEFRTVEGGTLYRAILVRTGISQTTVEYIIPGDEHLKAFSMTRPSLMSVYLTDPTD